MSTDKRIFSELPESDPPIRFSVRAKLMALFALALTLVFLVIFEWAYMFTTARAIERMRADLDTTLLGATQLVDGDELAALAKDGVRDPDGFSHDPRYLHQLKILEEVHLVEPQAFLYSFEMKSPTDVIYLVDVDVLHDKSKATPFLEPDTVSSTAPNEAWTKQKLVERPDIYSDRWGRWLSSYAPIRDHAGNVVAMMGADYEATYVEQIQGEIRRSVLVVFAGSYAFVLLLVWIAAGVFSRPIRDLTRATEALRENSLGKDLGLRSANDEIGALARAFSRMSRRLGRAFHQIEEQNEVLEQRVEERTADLNIEREKSETLLRNILPSDIATRLKSGPGDVIADGFEAVTVLFADIVGFTDMASRVSPLALVNMLNDIFSAFDRLAEKHKVEKIKTIGDAYMVVGGVPIARPDHAAAIADMAIDMQAVMTDLAATHAGLSIRIGVHSGPVVAGVLGTKKFSYDLWGDTVNVASRLESHGERGRIQISETVKDELGAQFEVEKRGPITLKGRGEMTTYWLIGRRFSA